MRGWALLLLLLAACSGNAAGFTGQCTSDAMCPVGAYCKQGLCACRSDDACAMGEFCNGQGVCQKREGCLGNQDCDASKFCNTTTGECIDRTSCGTDVHCPIGSVCIAASGHCIDGCRDEGDCPLYSVCSKPAGSSTSAIGNCLTGKCGDKTYCNYHEDCVNGACVRDNNPQRPLCNACDPNNPTACVAPDSYCLVNDSYDPTNAMSGDPDFCAPSCTADGQCPNGFQCGGVVLLTQKACHGDADCGGGGRVCEIGEGALSGACTCVQDSECTQDKLRAACAVGSCTRGGAPCFSDAGCTRGTCDLSHKTCFNPAGQPCADDTQCTPADLCAPDVLGRMVCQFSTAQSRCSSNEDCLCDNHACFGTGRPCQRNADCHIACLNNGCFLGMACAPDQGLSCPIVR